MFVPEIVLTTPSLIVLFPSLERQGPAMECCLAELRYKLGPAAHIGTDFGTHNTAVGILRQSLI